MAGSADQKRKLLYLMRILLEETDEEHPFTAAKLIERLADYNISAERKSVYADLALLGEFGLDVVRSTDPPGYFIGAREFETSELGLLVDAVQSAKFISRRKSAALIKKLERLASAHQAERLQRQVYLLDQAKTENESVYYSVDAIYQAIAANRQITFRYLDYAARGQKVYRSGGARYAVSPLALIWADENYYLAAYYEKYGGISNFRVDKMDGIALSDAPRRMDAVPAQFNPAEYAQKQFSMFGGEEETVRLAFEQSLAGVVIDRFGADTELRPYGDGRLSVRVRVTVSPVFFSWIFQFGRKMEIVSPDPVKRQMERQLRAVTELYGSGEGEARR